MTSFATFARRGSLLALVLAAFLFLTACDSSLAPDAEPDAPITFDEITEGGFHERALGKSSGPVVDYGLFTSQHLGEAATDSLSYVYRSYDLGFSDEILAAAGGEKRHVSLIWRGTDGEITRVANALIPDAEDAQALLLNQVASDVQIKDGLGKVASNDGCSDDEEQVEMLIRLGGIYTLVLAEVCGNREQPRDPDGDGGGNEDNWDPWANPDPGNGDEGGSGTCSTCSADPEYGETPVLLKTPKSGRPMTVRKRLWGVSSSSRSSC